MLPRNLYKHGAKFTGIDISENQIEQASILAKDSNMDIDFLCSSAEDIFFDKNIFDAVTACQCFAYFNHETLAPIISRILKPKGIFAVFYMEWLPFEDKIAKASEDLVLKYNPKWSGGGETRHYLDIPEAYDEYFTTVKRDIFDVQVPFTREIWNGRMKACRGIGASLSEDKVKQFEREHMTLLEKIAPPTFEVLHFVTAVIMKKRDTA